MRSYSLVADEYMALADDVKRRKAVFLVFRSSRQIETGTDFVSTLLYRLLKPVPTQIFCKMTYPSIFSPLTIRKSLNFVDGSTEISTATPREWKLRLFAVGMGLDGIIGVVTSVVL